MSMLSKGFKKVRKGLHLPPMTAKNVVTKYAPVAMTVASLGGLGPLAGVAGKVGSIASKIPGAAKVGGLFNTLGKSGLGQAARALNGGKAITMRNTLDGASKNLKRFGGAIGSSIADHPLESIAAGAAGVNAAAAFKRAGDYSGKAIKTKEQSYNERAPLRKRGVDGMLKNTTQPQQDFTNQANPFARKRKVEIPPRRGF
ncbi:MAG: hypothetical protein M3P26_16595 [Gemmatimonadota bacterium]|nr:hypothetical protein [Gemmatimonadota bacterium]